MVLGFEAPAASRYGRLIAEHGRLLRITEWKDASAAERALTFCNSGLLLAPAHRALRASRRGRHRQCAGRILSHRHGRAGQCPRTACAAVACDEAEVLGINSRAELARAEALFQAASGAEALETGVTLVAPETVHFALDTVIGRDAMIEHNVFFGPGVTVETARRSTPSAISRAPSRRRRDIGPYARLRPGAEIGDSAKVGNFVEIKKAVLGPGAKANHLTYIGDASVGEARTSAPAPSPATMTASSSTAPRSAPAPSSVRTACSWRRSRSPTRHILP